MLLNHAIFDITLPESSLLNKPEIFRIIIDEAVRNAGLKPIKDIIFKIRPEGIDYVYFCSEGRFAMRTFPSEKTATIEIAATSWAKINRINEKILWAFPKHSELTLKSRVMRGEPE